MFEDADPYNRGAITYEALKGQLEKHGGLLENLSIRYDEWNRLNDEWKYSLMIFVLFSLSKVSIDG